MTTREEMMLAGFLRFIFDGKFEYATERMLLEVYESLHDMITGENEDE